MKYPYLLSDNTLTVIINNRPYHTDRTNPHWSQIKEALTDPNTTDEVLIGLVNPITAITNVLGTTGKIRVEHGAVWYGNEQIANALATRILDILSEGLDIEPWIKFADNVYANPYPWAREELYLFLEKANLPITPDGCFIAYKKVRSDYKDVYSGTMSNKIGNMVVMPGGREAVDPNRNNTCSRGLHFCSKDYLNNFGGSRVMLVKINPADVVSIPSDYDNTKGRTWRYEVVGEIEQPKAESHSWSSISGGYGDHQWGPEDNLDEDDEGWEWDNNLVDSVEDEDEDTDDVFGIQTISCGLVTKEVFKNLVKTYGTMAGIAKAKGISAGTVQTWKVKLGL